MAFTPVTVTGTFKKVDGTTPAAGTVLFQATAEMQNGGQIRVPSPIQAPLDVNGVISVVLPATDDTGTLPTGVTFTVIEELIGSPSRPPWQLAVPHASATLDLSTVAPALPATPAYPYLLTTGNGLSVVQYCSPAGSDASDGSTWRNAKATFLAAYDALPAGGGTIFVTDGVSIGGSVANQGLWIAGPNDSQYSALPAGWRQQKDLHVIGVGNASGLSFRKGPQAGIGWGSGTDVAKPSLWITGTNTPFTFENLGFRYPAMWLRAGVDSASSAPFTTMRNTNTAGLLFVNCGGELNQVTGAGPGVDIGYLFWAYFDYCTFGANYIGQPTRTADNRAAVLVKPTEASSSLLFFKHCVGIGGGIKYSPGNTTWGLDVDDFVTENDTGYAVWLTSTPSAGKSVLCNIDMADNPFSGAPTIQIDGSGPPEAVLCVDVADVTGPATILSSNPAKWATINQTPAATGQVRLWQGRLAAQHDSDRRAFGAAAVRFANLANHDSSLWSIGAAVITIGISAPDGTTGAVRLSTAAGGLQSRRPGASGAVSSGDWVVAGVWYRANSGAAASTGGVGTVAVAGGTFVGGLNYFSLVAPLNGDGEWEWCAVAAQVNTGGSSASFDLNCDSSHASDVYAPVLLIIPSGTLSASEVAELTQHLHPYPKGAPIGSVSTYPNQVIYIPSGAVQVPGGLASTGTTNNGITLAVRDNGVQAGIRLQELSGGTSKQLRVISNNFDIVNNALSAVVFRVADSGATTVYGSLTASKDIQRSRQTPTEAVLVSGVDATAGEIVGPVTLTAARVVGAPLNPAIGQRLTYTLIEGGAGGFAVTWNAVFKVSWSDVGNTTGKRSSISFLYDGTNWNQDGAQTPYV